MDAPFPEGMIEETSQFLYKHKDLPDGQDLYPEVFKTQYQFPLQRQTELTYMMRTARSVSPKVVYEIGSDKPGGLFHWCKSIPTVERVIACEIRGTPQASLFEQAFPHIDFLWLPMSSYHPSTVKRVGDWLKGDPIDVMFLDGDKGNFITDWHQYHRFVRPGGIVFVHDITDTTPARQYHQMYGHRRHVEYVNTDDATMALERETAGLPIANPHEAWLRYWRGRSCGVGTIFI